MTQAASGIDLFIPEVYDIVWSLIILVIVAVFFYKFFMPKFNAIFDERAAKIQGNIAKAEQARKDADEAKAKYEAQLSQDSRRRPCGSVPHHRRRSFPRRVRCGPDHRIRTALDRIPAPAGHRLAQGRGRRTCHRPGRQDPRCQAGRQRRAVLDDRFDDRRSGRQEVTVTIRNQKGR